MGGRKKLTPIFFLVRNILLNRVEWGATNLKPLKRVRGGFG